MKSLLAFMPFLALAANDAAPPPDRHDLAVRAISVGVSATAKKDARRLIEAERLLVAAGARPEAGGADLAGRWRDDARRIARRALPPPPTRGRVLGSAYKEATLAAGGALAVEQIFLAGRKAKVSVVPGNGDALRFAVSDQEGKALCVRETSAKPASCSWLPAWTTRYRIEVRNPRPTRASVYLIID
jgi:hypothetical protein